MITRTLFFIALILSATLNASESSETTLKSADELATVEQLSIQLKELVAKLDALSRDNAELKDSIIPNIEEAKKQITQINLKNTEIAQYIKEQNVDYESLEKRDVDLNLFIDSPNETAWINFGAVIVSIGGSIGLSLYFLHRTLRRETDKQLEQIKIDANERKNEHLKLLDTQEKQHNASLESHIQLAKNEQQERHKVVIDEFRQKWINTFRDEASSYVRVAIQLLYFYKIEIEMLEIVKNLKSAERRCADFRSKFCKENSGLSRILSEKNNNNYRRLMICEREAREDFERVKPTYTELKKLESELIEKAVKISFMLNPDKDANNLNEKAFDNQIVELVNFINGAFISEERVYQALTNEFSINEKLAEFKRIVPLMLKAEWDRVQRKQ
ncbi:hypothetical protein [Shewanella mangrovisoli]|uniref:hypothetical protein n=1 Tax=Shewanella mangrovisoli TaxID=2864211 RepID=UPI001C6571AF|nr:hypothetical protein [Shewanella mangrovisoli]QYK09622.1 hypothetical protein K0H60_02655 [Shewanella mangrovisoli]